ncbi:MAG: DNA repair protein RadC [Chitinophagales bacterium]|nr:DNA repair protein RadC [Chitinophagales bacterium]MCZ2393003.1 DNA repair protein RadC [Chitinophagales bacterium]
MMYLFFMTLINNNYSNIKSWAEEDRPREKLLSKGRRSMTDAELLAILIGSGTQNQSALDLARNVLSITNNHLGALGNISIQQLMTVKGIGEAKAITIVSALELGRRRQQSVALEEKVIKCSRHSYELISPCIGDLSHEEFWVILLNRRGVVLKHKRMTKGGFAATIVDVRQIFKWAISEQASSIILAHNHPSGTLSPSTQDIQITNSLVKAGELLEIKVLDHIIVTSQGYYSFTDEGKIV